MQKIKRLLKGNRHLALLALLIIPLMLACASASTMTPTAERRQNTDRQPTHTPTRVRPSRTPTQVRPTRTPAQTGNQTGNQSRSTTRPLAASTRYIAGSSSSVNLRSEPSTDSNRITSIPFGTEVDVLDQKEVDQELWYEIKHNDKVGWVLGSLTTENRPIANMGLSTATPPLTEANVTLPPVQSVPTLATLSPEIATQIPLLIPTQEPFVPPPAPAGYACDCGKTCESMSCDEAYFQLNACGCGKRDGDNDGIPCENVCGG